MYAYYPDCVTEVTTKLQAQAMSMTYEEFSSDLPRHGTFGFTSVEQSGFSHLGRFSVEFRERFAESPRETLAARATSIP